jgi:hypothetical protein
VKGGRICKSGKQKKVGMDLFIGDERGTEIASTRKRECRKKRANKNNKKERKHKREKV